MKLRHLFLSVLAGLAFLTSCQDNEKDFGLPEITISQRDLNLGPEMSNTVLTVSGSRDWTVSTSADWISVNPSKGKAYTETRVTITILENAGYNRSSAVKFDIGYDSKTLAVTQEGALGEKSEGTGEQADPYSVAGVLAYLQTLGTEESPMNVYIKGKINAIVNTFESNASFGNATFTIVDEGGTDIFTAYRILYLGNKKWTAGKTDIKEGDEVVLCGKIVNYNGKTPETVSGSAYIYSLNGVTEEAGGGEDPTPGEAVYFNNFDKETATQTYGNSNNSWPFLDQFEGWKNETGTGIATVTYDFSAVSARANSASSGSYSDYSGSGSNNLFFGAD